MSRLPKSRVLALAAAAAGAALLAPGTVSAATPRAEVTAAQPTAGPDALPRDDGPWHQVFRDDFSGTAVNAASWSVFDGNHYPQYWNRSQVSVSSGAAHLRAQPGPDGHWITGAMSSVRALRQTYGKYLVRLRFGAGVGVRGVALLWPSGDPAPPELDFFEIDGSDPQRLLNRETVHYGTNYSTDHGMLHTSYSAPAGSSFRDWHTVGVEWSPGRIAYTCDGVVERVVWSHVPAEPMWLGLQQGQNRAGPAGTTPVDLDIDWVVAYAYSP